MLIYQHLGKILEEVDHVVVHVVQVLKDATGRCFDYFLWLWHTYSLELDACLALNLLDQLVGFLGIEGDASSRLASSSGSTRSMDVGLGVLWWFDLDDELHVLDVKASACDIGSNEDLELALLESLHGDFSLVLGNIAMHYLDVLLDLVAQNQRISVLLGLGEHDRFGVATITNQDVSQGRHSVVVGTLDG